MDALRHVHSCGLVHCDSSGLIKLIDFGVARRYQHPTTKEHIPESIILHRIGTTTYNSLNMHMHHNLSRRDDMEALAYAIADPLCLGLPWMRANESTDILTIERSWTGPKICIGYPAVFSSFIDYTRSLAFRDEPVYDAWRARFLDLDAHGWQRPSSPDP
ncbi:kinase-like domain-containing protein [Schizophyllum fasciatum]